LRKIPPGTAPLLARPVDYDTLLAIVRRLKDGKAPGCDGFLREFYKYGPPALIALLQAAINAFIAGLDPTVNPEEWLGALIALLPKSLAALMMSEFRPAGKPCAKFVIFSKVIDGNFRRSIEEYKTVDEAQEGFRPNRNTKRQITKLQCLLERAKRRQTISVMLYLDIKNAFNAINHRAMLAVLRACGYPEQDVELFRRMYAGTFLMVANQFGLSAACFLLRGVLQGAPTSPNVFNVAFNPVHVLVRACKRGCAPLEGTEPMGSSGFADDTTLHSDGSDAVPAMQVIVQAATPFLDWLGLLLNMRKSVITAIDHATGRAVATDSITFNGKPFTALPPDTAHKALGVLMTLTGNYKEHKDYVMAKMEKRCMALADADSIPRGELRELAVTSGIVAIFRATAGVVPWTGTELDRVSKLWIRAFKQAWEYPTNMDSTVIILENADSGRACPSARAVWTEDTLTVLDQCIQLPGIISALVLDHWRVACSSRGCVALNQLQKVIRIDGAAESIVELLALRLDEQGTEFSTPWPPEPGSLVLEALWPQVQDAWRAKQGWKGCTELSTAVQEQWEQAKFSLKMCTMLGKVGILHLTQLTPTTGRGLRWEELRAKQCEITKTEYLQLLSYLQHGDERMLTSEGETGNRVEGHYQTPELAPQYHPVSCPLVSELPQLPSCIIGRVCSKTTYERYVMEQYPREAFSDTELNKLSDTELMHHLCNARAVFQYTMDGESYFAVECLTPLSRVWNTPRGQEAIVVQVLHHVDQKQRVGVIGMPLIRDSLKDNGRDNLAEACHRPSWIVSREEVNVWFPSTRWDRSKEEQSTQLSWQLLPTGVDGQQQFSGLSQGIVRRRESTVRITRALIPSYIWHTDPPLPSKIEVDLSNHLPKQLPAPVGWEILQRNAKVLITDTQQRTFGLDAAQYGMLLALDRDRCSGRGVGNLLAPTESFLLSLKLVCKTQRRVDSEYVVPWNRHFITCVQQLTDTHLLLGVSAVTYNPHFEFFASPHSRNEDLGAVQAWPEVRALLLLDSIEPELRQEWLHKAAEHTHRVWILRSHKPSMAASADLRTLSQLKAQCIALLPAGCFLLHNAGFWQNAEWDSRTSEHAAQLWLLEESVPGCIKAPKIGLSLEALGDWSGRRYDFHWCNDRVPPALRLYRQFQQDALQYTFTGLVGGTDGSACMRTDRMGAGFALGTERIPLLQFSAPVGGPVSSMRAEAASLLQYLRRVRAQFPDQHALLIFIDCLVLLDILMKWGKSEFQPQPRDIVHFDVLVPLLTELRLWPGTVLLMKIKSHAGCLLNERADELADIGVKSEVEPISPGPSKHGSVWLRIRESWRQRVCAEKLHHVLPRDTAPNKSILKVVSAVNFLRAMTKRNTQYVRHLLHREEGRVLSQIVHRNDDAVLRVWYKAMTGIYPVQVYLHRIGAVKSPQCPHCSNNELETFTHFACACPAFREARTAAHNQVRAVLADSLKNALAEDWIVLEETPLASTGLKLQQVPDEEVCRALDVPDLHVAEAGNVQLDRWQPDFTLISWKRKRIAVLELTRPSDMLNVQLDEAYRRKKRKYGPIKSALHHYIRGGWTIEILPWVIGIRGLTDTEHLQTALSFLDIPKQKWKAIIEDSVLASVRALAYLHRIRYSSSNRKPTPDKLEQQMLNARTSRKRRRPRTESMEEMRQRWTKLKDNSKWRSRGRPGGCATSSTLSSHIKIARERRGEG
jgi:ribonuclease HI